MKKLGIVFAIIAILALVGCASSGGSKATGDGAPPFTVDLSTVNQHVRIQEGKVDRIGDSLGPQMRNQEAYTSSWQGAIYVFPENFVDTTQYSRVTIRLKYFNADGEELGAKDGMGMAVFIYDLEGDWHGPAMGPGPNTPLKEMNVGGFSGLVHPDRGVRIRLNRAPQGIFIQKAQDVNVAFVELAEITFHNGNYESGKEVMGEGPEGS
ncbi:MAG: hypothetical protein LBU66_02355 [Treponema sp.]|jgi:hypothetical protein|nr:hypothetical protein [Treponema sp.]